jgi:hypothetical protein
MPFHRVKSVAAQHPQMWKLYFRPASPTIVPRTGLRRVENIHLLSVFVSNSAHRPVPACPAVRVFAAWVLSVRADSARASWTAAGVSLSYCSRSCDTHNFTEEGRIQYDRPLLR